MRGIKKLLLCLLAALTVLTVTVLGNGVVNAGTPKEKNSWTGGTHRTGTTWSSTGCRFSKPPCR